MFGRHTLNPLVAKVGGLIQTGNTITRKSPANRARRICHPKTHVNRSTHRWIVDLLPATTVGALCILPWTGAQAVRCTHLTMTTTVAIAIAMALLEDGMMGKRISTTATTVTRRKISISRRMWIAGVKVTSITRLTTMVLGVQSTALEMMAPWSIGREVAGLEAGHAAEGKTSEEPTPMQEDMRESGPPAGAARAVGRDSHPRKWRMLIPKPGM